MAQFEPDLPMFWGHGTIDEDIPLDMAEECIKFLQEGLKFPEDRFALSQILISDMLNNYLGSL